MDPNSHFASRFYLPSPWVPGSKGGYSGRPLPFMRWCSSYRVSIHDSEEYWVLGGILMSLQKLRALATAFSHKAYIWHVDCGPLEPLSPLEWSCSITPFEASDAGPLSSVGLLWIPWSLLWHRTLMFSGFLKHHTGLLMLLLEVSTPQDKPGH